MLTRIRNAATNSKNIQLRVLHEGADADLAGGNKRFKLAPYMQSIFDAGYTSVLSFGGAYSNHIHALATAAGRAGVHSIGVIRGEPEYADNPTLSDARFAGMELVFTTREEYRRRHDPLWLTQWAQRYPGALIIPEGGSNLLAARNCASILDPLEQDYLRSVDIFTCAVGTGATFCGLHSKLTQFQKARGYQVVRDSAVPVRVQRWIEALTAPGEPALWQLVESDHPGYAKLSTEHYGLIDEVLEISGVLLDPVYTAKMLWQVLQDIERGTIASGSSVLAVHTGGLQGWRGFMPEARAHLSGSTLDVIRDRTAQGYDYLQ